MTKKEIEALQASNEQMIAAMERNTIELQKLYEALPLFCKQMSRTETAHIAEVKSKEQRSIMEAKMANWVV